MQFLGPVWLGVAVSIYASYKALREGLKILGVNKTSKKEMKEAEIERKKKHYLYHCERNPEGFLRLMAENFNQDNIDSTLKESEKLKSIKKE